MDAKSLAQLVLKVLDAQKEYFRSRDKEQLRECKRLEEKLRDACYLVIDPTAPHPEQPPSLF